MWGGVPFQREQTQFNREGILLPALQFSGDVDQFDIAQQPRFPERNEIAWGELKHFIFRQEMSGCLKQSLALLHCRFPDAPLPGPSQHIGHAVGAQSHPDLEEA